MSAPSPFATILEGFPGHYRVVDPKPVAIRWTVTPLGKTLQYGMQWSDGLNHGIDWVDVPEVQATP